MTAAGAATLAAVASVQAGETDDSVVVRSLNFSFPFSRPVIHDLSLELPRGSRCLLTGANGAGVWRGARLACRVVLPVPALPCQPIWCW
jgi:ABC-type transport system involved in cytochrome bd biosynthesis fused ATPase/permease subunit